ncbi:oxysterol-binding -related 2, partial [Brachionus plicatilis]
MSDENQRVEREKKNYESHEFRVSLQSEMVDRSKYSIWSILRQCVDKELYRFTIPIVWNEPLSMLQRLAENLKYSNELLDKASESMAAIDRMKHVTAFLVSSTSIHSGRLSKPFNPLLGETYEHVSPEKKYRICCEQVSHHPPVSAYHAESIKLSNSAPKWKYYGSVLPHMKLNIL